MLTVAVLSNNVITKAALDRGLEPLIYIFLRLVLVAALLIPYLWLRHVPLRVRWPTCCASRLRSLWIRVLQPALCGRPFAHVGVLGGHPGVALSPIFILMLSALSDWNRCGCNGSGSPFPSWAW